MRAVHGGSVPGWAVLLNALLAGMTAPVRLFQVRNRQMQITLGCGQRTMPKHLLDVPQIGMVAQQVRGATVPPQVTGDVLLDLRELGVFLDHLADGVLGHWRSQRDSAAAAPDTRRSYIQ